MYGDIEDERRRFPPAVMTWGRPTQPLLPRPCDCSTSHQTGEIVYFLNLTAQKEYSQAYHNYNYLRKIPTGYSDQLLKNLSSKTSKVTLFIAQITKFSNLKANILLNRVRPVGIPEKRSNRPPGSGTKNFAGPFFQKKRKIQQFLLKNRQIWPF